MTKKYAIGQKSLRPFKTNELLSRLPPLYFELYLSEGVFAPLGKDCLVLKIPTSLSFFSGCHRNYVIYRPIDFGQTFGLKNL